LQKYMLFILWFRYYYDTVKKQAFLF